MTDFPSFDSLPLRKGDPKWSAWGLHGQGERERNLGALNYLTNQRVVAAAREIQNGKRFSLNWGLGNPTHPTHNRIKMKQEMIEIYPNVNDDVITFNTQTSTQFDGLRHYSYPDGRFYNGLRQKDIYAEGQTELGIHHWAQQGIIGRGVLLDIYSFAIQAKLPYDPMAQVAIPLSTIQRCAEYQNVTFHPGDILCLRYGWTNVYDSWDASRRYEFAKPGGPTYAGFEQSEDALRWLWDKKLAAICADSPSFEPSPSLSPWLLHEAILAGWGCPIGELFDFEKLAEQCKAEKRWTFFFTSEPLDVPGGVASPPNAVGIM